MSQETKVKPHNVNVGNVWSAGGQLYDQVSQGITDAIQHCILRLGLKPGDKVLDIATGTGWAARGCAVKGAKVMGIDIGEDLIQAAREISKANKVPAEFRVADAEALPFEDASFDKVISTFGVMFTSRPEVAAFEIARVCKKGGKVALATWPPWSNVVNLYFIMKPFMPSPRFLPPLSSPPPFPYEWGKRERVKQLLGSYFDLGFESAVSYLRESSGAAFWEIFSKGHGPTKIFSSGLDPENYERLKNEFIFFHDRFQNELGISMPRDYLITVGVRR